MKKKRIPFISSLIILLVSCSNGYKEYFGNIYESKYTSDEEIKDVRIMQNKTIRGDYYANIITIQNQERLDKFYSDEKNSFSSEEIKRYRILPDGYAYLFFRFDVPDGYSYYRRDNIQVKQGKEEVLLSDNFYRYVDDLDMYYCNIDLKIDEKAVEEEHSFFYILPSTFFNYFEVNSLRMLYRIN